MTQSIKRIGLACDHAGFEIKEILKQTLLDSGYEVVDYGTNSTDSVDYPDFAHALAYGISSSKHEVDMGVAVCGSGNGICMTLNKHPEVRAGLSWNSEIAQLARAHNNANVLCIPGRYVTSQEAKDILTAFLNTDFEGGRHQNRVNKIPM